MTNQPLTSDIIRHIADLAMISLTDDEITKYQKQIGAILEYVKKLQTIDTDDISYQSHIELKNVLRNDISEPSLTQDAATQNRKDSSKQGFFAINMVLPNDES